MLREAAWAPDQPADLTDETSETDGNASGSHAGSGYDRQAGDLPGDD